MTWVWPFPRLRFRLRHGYWCEHVRRSEPQQVVAEGEFTLNFKTEPAWLPGDGGRADGWRRIDTGERQMRRCGLCEWVEFR